MNQQAILLEACLNRIDFLTLIKSIHVPLDDEKVRNVSLTFRWLRNNAPDLQDCTKQELLKSGIVEICSWFFDKCFVSEPLNSSIILQFLNNLSINHKSTQHSIFLCFHSKLKKYILSTKHSNLLNSLIMLLYNLCLQNVSFKLDVLRDFYIIKNIMTHWNKKKEIEYCKIFLDSIFSDHKSFELTYTHLPDDSKDQLMNLLSVWLDYYEDIVSFEVMEFIKTDLFISCTIDQITGGVVNVLAKASNISRFHDVIQNYTPLLEKTMDILTVIHEDGKKSSDNEFSRINDLSALFINSDVISHNRYGFKTDIIRLITNMCFNHQNHQNLIRDKDIIPILLECCSFDAKNPVMREWCLLALRNIMSGNQEDYQIFSEDMESHDPAEIEEVI
ncbi:Armadillo-type fold,Armadillo-like helical,Ataxin-10 domain [Cinara cedri]|uniref:Ataxin-10 n=1 Tax=Cinara cedri TaxID=506608 RepID=A0A5E4NS74_9HEMI|nr:Armadillo-type fold,Armadillo-like helical,Ataxin-10 domain [Cinara cedri]